MAQNPHLFLPGIKSVYNIGIIIYRIVLYYIQLSADIKMKNYKIKTSFNRPMYINFMIFLIIVDDCVQYDAIHYFAV